VTTTAAPDRFASARAVADATLYEGYVLYPYRASSQKNQVRWQFGVLTPRSFSDAEGSERWRIRTECLVETAADLYAGPADRLQLGVRIRCLQVQRRRVEAPDRDGGFAPVGRLEVDGEIHVDWDEAVDQVVDLAAVPIESLLVHDHEQLFVLDGGGDEELLSDRTGCPAGRVLRRREELRGRVVLGAALVPGDGRLVKLSVVVENATTWSGDSTRREDVLGHCLVAAHTMLAVDDGVFVSLLDPPERATEAAATCRNDGTFPVLIGNDDVLLSSPIILYDHPEVAPESAGDLYDATEIDEILALRVLTLTDEEKAEARGTDPRSAAVIDRVDGMPPEVWGRLHGAIRSLKPVEDEPAAVPWWDPEADASVDPWSDSVWIAGVEVGKGSAVRLSPSHRADAQDLFLAGMTATVAGVFSDVDGSQHVAVTLDDDPATTELAWQGRYLFFHPDEVEPLDDGGSAA